MAMAIDPKFLIPSGSGGDVVRVKHATTGVIQVMRVEDAERLMSAEHGPYEFLEPEPDAEPIPHAPAQPIIEHPKDKKAGKAAAAHDEPEVKPGQKPVHPAPKSKPHVARHGAKRSRPVRHK